MVATKSLASVKLIRPSKSSSSSNSLIKTIRELEERIKTSSNQDLNPIADLVELFGKHTKHEEPNSSTKVIHALIYSLHRIFSTLIRQGRIHATPIDSSSTGSVEVVKEWLKTQYAEYVGGLLKLLRSKPREEDQQLGLDGLTILMSLVRSESELVRSLKAIDRNRNSSGTDIKHPTGGFQSKTFRKLSKTLLDGTRDDEPVQPNVRAEFITRYFNFCDDIRYHFLKDIAFICQSRKCSVPDQDPQVDTANLTVNVLNYLESLTTMPTESDELNQFWTGKPLTTTSTKKRKAKSNLTSSKKVKIDTDGSTGVFDDPSESVSENDEVEQTPKAQTHPLLSLRAHQKAFSECWISFLGLKLDDKQVKRVLKMLHAHVIPHMIDPKILMDFLVDCIDFGGSISILTLNALFTLMTKHNLDYPAFYTRLYSLLDHNALHTRYRPKLFRMLETFLSSTHLPVNIVASFIKKMARLSLFAPPGAIITIIPFSYNLIKKHPSCMSMLHRNNQAATGAGSPSIKDPFNFYEPDPLQSGAIYSSLWEFSGLRSHYLSSVSTLAKIFSEAFDKPKYDMEDFFDHTYGSFFETEINREIRKAPALSILASTYIPNDKYPKIEVDDVVSQMWSFQ